MPPSVSSRTSRPPAPSTSTVSWNSASTRIRSAYSATGGIRTPSRRAAVSGASGSSSAVNSCTAQPVSRCTSSASPGSVPAIPVCTGFTTITERPASAARRASAAVATVLPTPVAVPVTTTTRPVTGGTP